MKRVLVLSALFLLLAGCNAGKNKTNIEVIPDMMDQESIKAQDWDPKRPGQVTMLTPPAGTVPRGFRPYKYTNPVEAEQKLKNPYKNDFTPELISLGKKNYEIYCSVCHGSTGAGDGPVAEKMLVKPPALTSERVRGFKGGRIFHIITVGQGVMGSYATQIREEKARWAVVNYIRNLQRASGGKSK